MPYSTREITPQLVKMNKKKGIVTLENHNTLAYIECNFKGAYFIRSMLILTELFNASPLNIPFCSSAKSIS